MNTVRGEFDIAAKLYWRGALTQAMALDLGAELVDALNECGVLTVNLGGVQSLDFSTLVLLCAVKRQAHERGQILSLEGLENPAVALVVQRYGHNGQRLCRSYCGDSCLFDTKSPGP